MIAIHFFFEHHGMGNRNLFRVNRLQIYEFPAHMHRAFELIYLRSGQLSLQVEQKQFNLKEGELAFIFCNQIHSLSASNESDVVIVLFSPEMIGDFYLTYKDRVPDHNVLMLDTTVDFFQMHSIYAQKSTLYHICDRLLSESAMSPANAVSQHALLQQMFAHVDENICCSLKSMAKSLQYDYAYLSKLFIRFTGVHFTEYLNRYRIAQACYLLKNNHNTISEIASACGYSTLRTFHRNFRLVMGCSPKEYIDKND